VSPLRTVRALWRLLRVVVHGLHGLAVVWWVLPHTDEPGRHERVRWWSIKLLRVMGISLQAQGQFRAGATLVVANHISWLDIMAVHALCPQARFVSKADVQGWPLVGRLVAAGGTLYIQREKRRDAMRVVHQMAEALRQGEKVAVFPEGTTADGHALLPFHANLLQAAIVTGTPVQPVALRYRDAEHAVSLAAQFVGETTLAQSLWRLVLAEGLVVQVQVLDARETAHADRRALAVGLRDAITQALESLDRRPA
jgi:1-acyl-sn-glycerol-3-phosphate acyltransferase